MFFFLFAAASSIEFGGRDNTKVFVVRNKKVYVLSFKLKVTGHTSKGNIIAQNSASWDNDILENFYITSIITKWFMMKHFNLRVHYTYWQLALIINSEGLVFPVPVYVLFWQL